MTQTQSQNASPSRTSATSPASPADTFGELRTLVGDYARQETVDPLKRLGTWTAFGVAGAVFVTLGVFLLSMGLLRLLQTQTNDTFDGNWSWAPYLITLVPLLIVIGLAAWGVKRRTDEVSEGGPA